MVEQYRGEGKRPKRRGRPAHLREAQAAFSGVVLPTQPEIEKLSEIAEKMPGARIVRTQAPMKIDGLQF